VKVHTEQVKASADEELRLRKVQLDQEKTDADEGLRKDKDRIDERKKKVEEETKHKLDELKRRRDQEDIDNTAAQRAADDAVTATQRRIADVRLAQDRADHEEREQVRLRYEAEQKQIAATYTDRPTGLIPKLEDALAAYDRTFDLRKTAIDDGYNNEQAQINATFDHPQTGLFAKLQRAYDDTKSWYDKRTTEVNTQYDNEKEKIRQTFDDPQTGLFAKLKAVHDATVEGLKGTEEDWNKNFKEPILKVTGETFAEIGKQFDRLLKDQKIDVKGPEGDEPSGQPRGGGGGGAGPGPGGVPSPWRVTFPYNAPYNGPFAGGAMWQGGPSHHQGVDLALPGPNNGMGKTYGAFQPGTVYWKGYESAGGNGLIIRTPDGLYNYYGHSQRLLVDVGDEVKRGQPIGVLGESGTEGSPHLHYAVRTGVNSGHIDPVPYMSEGGGQPGDQDLGPGMKVEGGYLIFTLFGRQYRIKLPATDFLGPGGAQGEIFQRLLAAARDAASKYGLPGAIMAAIPIQEGVRSQLQTKYHNLFSIKGTGPAGSVTLPTEEVIDGQRVTVNAKFRVYNNEAESFMDFGKLITESGIYDDAVEDWRAKHDPKSFIRKVGRRYATDPDWPDKVLKIAGYRYGGYIPEPTLLVGRTLGPYAMAGEAAPEWVTPQAPGGGGGGPLQRAEMPIILGNREVERIWIEGYQLNVRRGRAMQPAHRRVV